MSRKWKRKKKSLNCVFFHFRICLRGMWLENVEHHLSKDGEKKVKSTSRLLFSAEENFNFEDKKRPGINWFRTSGPQPPPWRKWWGNWKQTKSLLFSSFRYLPAIWYSCSIPQLSYFRWTITLSNSDAAVDDRRNRNANWLLFLERAETDWARSWVLKFWGEKENGNC